MLVPCLGGNLEYHGAIGERGFAGEEDTAGGSPEFGEQGEVAQRLRRLPKTHGANSLAIRRWQPSRPPVRCGLKSAHHPDGAISSPGSPAGRVPRRSREIAPGLRPARVAGEKSGKFRHRCAGRPISPRMGQSASIGGAVETVRMFTAERIADGIVPGCHQVRESGRALRPHPRQPRANRGRRP